MDADSGTLKSEADRAGMDSGSSEGLDADAGLETVHSGGLLGIFGDAAAHVFADFGDYSVVGWV